MAQKSLLKVTTAYFRNIPRHYSLANTKDKHIVRKVQIFSPPEGDANLKYCTQVVDKIVARLEERSIFGILQHYFFVRACRRET